MKVPVYLFILFTVFLSCVEAQFQMDVMRSLLSPRQSTSDCDDILPEMCTKPIEEKFNATNTSNIQDEALAFSFAFSIICGVCNDEYIRFYECEGDDEAIETIRGAYCAVNDDGEYCGVVYLDDFASGVFSPESCEDCETYCEFYEFSSSLFGCCAASLARFNLFIDERDCDTDLGEPCSGSSLFATPMFLEIITLTVITVLTLF